MTALADILAKPPSPPRCTVGQAVENHPDGKAIATALDNPSWGHVALSKVLREAGINAGERLIRNHRAGVCKCGPA